VIRFVQLDLPIVRGRAPFHHHGDAFVAAFGIAKRGFQPLASGVALPGKSRVRLKIGQVFGTDDGSPVMSSGRWMTFRFIQAMLVDFKSTDIYRGSLNLYQFS
jgi:hypothetical protein